MFLSDLCKDNNLQNGILERLWIIAFTCDNLGKYFADFNFCRSRFTAKFPRKLDDAKIFHFRANTCSANQIWRFFSRHYHRTYKTAFLAHLSKRLICELIGYSWSGVRPSFTMLKDLLLRNHFANQSQILSGASLGSWNDILFAASGSLDQDGCNAHIWLKTLQKSSLEPAS